MSCAVPICTPCTPELELLAQVVHDLHGLIVLRTRDGKADAGFTE